MPDESFQERTEKATPRRRQEAREKGQVAKSRELASVSVLLGGLFTLYWGSAFFYHQLTICLRYYFGRVGSISIDDTNILGVSYLIIKQLFVILAPIFLVVVVLAILSNILQFGFIFTSEPLVPKFSRINPLEGVKRLFSAQSFAELLKSLFKVAVVGYVAYVTVRAEFENIPLMLQKSPFQILAYLGQVSFAIFWKTCAVMIVLSILDYLFQRWDFEKNLRMTRQELKEEFKQTEGDPQVKSRIRSIQREMARKRMMAEVPEADVVITNPTKLAVALRYEPGAMDAPKVVAKGSGYVAQRIKDIAYEHDVPVVENKPLAQSLFRSCNVGDIIPESLYKVVAEVLAYVYRLKGKVQ
ncbi:Flagellar biosynthesis protein FlhB [Dissulfuribacter thermophilus]|uniref:Flagellar biosynthetic protein FlhB n=1 Tax=Dissulfuribacter thermophilus TaxID=1156395 RepID=A0A1B9F8I4_9BACT|nr:flagellar biosynthesis protein FlhB [Dissulfuribacter thermophilus]OCC16091.1 Flagellar biosynthesis protein FlhB [Dissulfuribacter thermophilus]